MRWGSFRQTYQGRLEDSLPFIFMWLPEWWRKEHRTAWDNLRRNTRSLTTPFDLHETLRDILEPKRMKVKVRWNAIHCALGFFKVPGDRKNLLYPV